MIPSYLYDFYRAQLLLKGCRGENISGTSEEYEFLISGSSLYRLFSENSFDWITEWYINGPLTPLYTRPTYRELNFTYKRIRRDFGNLTVFENEYEYSIDGRTIFKDDPRKKVATDYMLVEFKDEKKKDVCFIVHSVPDFYNPEWSKKVGIEYNVEWNIPTQEEREKISEIVSFLFGCQLIKIGETKFGNDGSPIEELSITPNIDPEINLKNLSKNRDINPIRYSLPPSIYPSPNSIETHLKLLIPSYIQKRDELNLYEVLWRYWFSQSLPSYAKLVILAGGFELLSEYWHESNESKSHGKFLPRKEFKKLSKNIKAIKKDIDKLEYTTDEDEYKYKKFAENKKKISDKLSQLNNMGTKAGIDNFLNEINLKIGKVEQEAIKYRNKPAHGKSVDTIKIQKCENAYRTLFNRAILKILGYQGDYIDYYSNRNITRQIDEPVSENNI